jgi:uncharacterized phage protein (TIGR01671 family)
MLYEFRGLDIETNKWVYGSLFDHKGHYPEILSIRPDGNGKAVYDRIAVVPESVSIWTGMFDCKGKKIFSKDIIEVRLYKCIEPDGSEGWEETYNSPVEDIFDDFSVRLPESHDFEYTTIHALKETTFDVPEIEVIGNILQNPELI